MIMLNLKINSSSLNIKISFQIHSTIERTRMKQMWEQK